MPSFTFTSPEGQSYTVNGPEGATEEQAWGVLQQQLGAPAKPAAAPVARRAEDVGFLEGAASSLVKGIQSFGDIASGYSLAGKQLTGNEADVRAKMAEIKREAQKIENTPGMTFEDLQRIYKQSGIVDALAQLPKYATEQILQSAPQMAVPLAAGEAATMLTAPALGPAAPLAGLAAGITAYGAQQFGNLMQRQAQEIQRPEDISAGRAAAAAALTAPVGYIVDRFATGLGGLGEKGIVEVTKELAKRKAAGEIGMGAVAAGVAKQAGKGAAEGFIAEAPTEVLESVAERAQAKLPLTDEQAKREYLESFMGAGVAGGAIGGGSRGAASVKGYRAAQEEAAKQAEAQAAVEKELAAQAAVQPEAAAPAAPAEAPAVTPAVTPAEPAVDINAPAQDREAMLKELEDQLAAIEGAPLEQVKVEPVAEKPQPVAEAPVEPVEAETPVEAEKPKQDFYSRVDAELAKIDSADTLVAELARMRDRQSPLTVNPQVDAIAARDALLSRLAAKDPTTAAVIAKEIQDNLDRYSESSRFPVEKLTSFASQISKQAPTPAEPVAQATPAATVAPAAKAKPAAKETPLRKASYAKNPFMTFLADKGLRHVKGEANSLKNEFSPDKQIMVSGHGPVFKSSGKQLDELLPMAIEYGYLPPGATEQELYGLVQKAVSGQKIEPVYSEKGVEDTAAKYEERMRLEQERHEEPAGFTADEDLKRRIDDTNNNGISADQLREDWVAGDKLWQPKDEAGYEYYAGTPAPNRRSAPTHMRRLESVADVNKAEQEGLSFFVATAKPELELKAQTAEELKAKAEKAEHVAKEEERKTKEAEAKAKADAEREEFVLTGSNRPADEAAARGQTDIFGEGEAPTLLDIDRNKQQDRQDKIREYAGVQRRRTTLEKKVIAGEATIDLQRDLTRLKDTADDLKADIDASKEPRRSARNFFADATKAWDNGHISDEVYQTIKLMFEKHPTLLEGLKLSVRQGPEGSTAAGEFKPYARFINLYKDTRGVENPSTIRHEITHSLEQMMNADVRKAVIDAWYADMAKAMRKFQDKAHQDYFKAVLAFFDKPNVENQRKAMDLLPSYDMYQYLNPSEYWAVNAEQLMGRHLSGAWGRFVNTVKRMFEGMKKLFGFDNKSAVHKAFATIMSGTHERLDKKVLANYVKDAEVTLSDIAKGVPPTDFRNYKGEEMAPAEWNNPVDTKFDTFQYKIVDKHIDTKRVIENIKKAAGDLADKFNAYIKEELYHGRTAKGVHDFLQKELLPITKDMKAANVTIDELDEYLHNRHAEEYNEHINKINPNPKLQDKGSGISTEAARAYMAGLSDERRAVFEGLAKQIDSIVRGTQDMLVKTGIESKDTIAAWRKAFPFYVPLKRDELEYVTHGGGVGAGLGTRGGVSKRATGSLKSVVDIFENIALQREQAIMKSEKARVGRALYGLAIQNPNAKFWLPINPDAIKNKEKLAAEIEDLGLNPEDAANIAKEPVTASFDKKTGMVKYSVNPLLRNSDNVFPVRINGQDRFIIFNSSDPRAKRMVESLKNLDAEQMGLAMGTIGEVTRFMASVNTQYNPVFGAWNFLRDVQGAALNLTTTEIAGQEKEVLKGVWPALKSIYADLRAQRAGKEPTGKWQELFEQYQKAGGATGYKEQFSRGNDKPGIVARELGKLDRGNVRKAADAVFNWLSDYNDAMENAVRLSAFKVALDQGFSEDKAASIAKNLTVNFNRKGASSPTMQALYAFFNASVQGTKRLAETLKGPAGRKIVAGGFTLGAIQAIALAMAGYDDDEPPEFLKDKNLIIPVTGGDYLIVPMPMGFNIFPGLGRLTTEYILGQAGLITGAKGLGDKTLSAASLVLDSFNPLGSGSLLQIVSPTAFDPLAAIQSNKDAFGRPISKEDRATAPTPGFMRSREGASWFSKNLAEVLNYISSPIGTKYTKGAISPTADQLDYLIGQYTGGVGREAMKTGNYIAAAAKGETAELPSYRVPIVGKVYGETTTPAAISAKFYQNVTELAQHENEIKQRIKNKEDTREYRADHPEVRFINRANYLENQITQLNKQKKALQERGAPDERIKKIDEQKTALMKGLNDQIKKLQQ